jgi:hypothetical protein
MPRYTLHRPADADAETGALEELRRDARVRLVGELPRMLLIESSPAVADEWASKMKGWKLALEQRARLPDPRPKLKRPLR